MHKTALYMQLDWCIRQPPQTATVSRSRPGGDGLYDLLTIALLMFLVRVG
jgi:hypothetical protein